MSLPNYENVKNSHIIQYPLAIFARIREKFAWFGTLPNYENVKNLHIIQYPLAIFARIRKNMLDLGLLDVNELA